MNRKGEELEIEASADPQGPPIQDDQKLSICSEYFIISKHQ